MVNVTVFRDGADLLVRFDGPLPAGFAGFGYPAGAGVVVRCPAGDRTTAMIAADYVRDAGLDIGGRGLRAVQP